jgi:5'-3' exonuclease
MVDRFNRLFESQLVSMKKKLKFAWKNFYLVKDCMREDIWRMRLFGEYKQNRPDNDVTGFNPIVFDASYQTVIPSMIAQYGISMIGHPTAEADDCIAVIHKHVREQEPNRKITIITNDNDYLQLKDDYTTLVNSNMKDISERYGKDIMDVFGIWKAIRGDVSDNIPAIDKKIGDKTAAKLATNKDILDEKLKNVRVRDRFELNKRLIMFEYIPDDIRSKVIDTWTRTKK